MTTTTTHHPVGTRVQYEDMANPLSAATITAVNITRWGVQYLLAWDADSFRATLETTSTSDLRQRGWTVL